MVLVVCDSSSLISLSESCLINTLPFLKQKLGLNFVIPPSVQDEIVNHPLQVKRFSFSVVRIRKLLREGVLSVISSPSLMEETKRISENANSLFKVRNRPLKIIQSGEAQCMGLFSSISASIFLIDEKTNRMLLENPLKLANAMHSEYGDDLEYDDKKFSFFTQIGSRVKVIRSTEIIALAFENGYFDEYKDDKTFAFHAFLQALRKAGCSIASTELDEYESLYA